MLEGFVERCSSMGAWLRLNRGTDRYKGCLGRGAGCVITWNQLVVVGDVSYGHTMWTTQLQCYCVGNKDEKSSGGSKQIVCASDVNL